MPAPPLESEPAMVSRSPSCGALGLDRGVDERAQGARRRLRLYGRDHAEMTAIPSAPARITAAAFSSLNAGNRPTGSCAARAAQKFAQAAQTGRARWEGPVVLASRWQYAADAGIVDGASASPPTSDSFLTDMPMIAAAAEEPPRRGGIEIVAAEMNAVGARRQHHVARSFDDDGTPKPRSARFDRGRSSIAVASFRPCRAIARAWRRLWPRRRRAGRERLARASAG